MKKLIAVLLILALFLPAAALADDLGIVGCWARYDLLGSGAPSMSILYLSEDHTSYFLTQAFNTEEPLIGRAHVGTWDLLQDGTVYVQSGENTHMELRFADGYYVAYDRTKKLYYLNLDVFQLN